MITLNNLFIFHTVAKHRSIAATAREWGIDRKSVQNSIKKIEAALGEPVIVIRKGGPRLGKVSLTPAGEWLYQCNYDAIERLLISSQHLPLGLAKASRPREFQGTQAIVRVAP